MQAENRWELEFNLRTKDLKDLNIWGHKGVQSPCSECVMSLHSPTSVWSLLVSLPAAGSGEGFHICGKSLVEGTGLSSSF